MATTFVFIEVAWFLHRRPKAGCAGVDEFLDGMLSPCPECASHDVRQLRPRKPQLTSCIDLAKAPPSNFIAKGLTILSGARLATPSFVADREVVGIGRILSQRRGFQGATDRLSVIEGPDRTLIAQRANPCCIHVLRER
jgi:hypothetical protein